MMLPDRDAEPGSRRLVRGPLKLILRGLEFGAPDSDFHNITGVRQHMYSVHG